jgi:adenylosuccinate synthase
MDVDTGLYPYVDNFHTTTGAVCTGLGILIAAIETKIGEYYPLFPLSEKNF